MSLAVFWDVVEIRTKLASFFPFVIGVLFSASYFEQLHWGHTLIFFVGMLCFDMATTAINNYMDFKKAKSEEYKYQENIIGRAQVPEKNVQLLIFSLIGIAMLVGLYLTWQTGWLLLVMGGICCFIGIFYTFGPVPLSRMPLGEVFSGFTMGLGIFAITIYINTFDAQIFFLNLNLKSGTFALTGSLWSVLAIVWASLPMVFTIANIMLANNLSDLEQDIANHRYTLPYYIGRRPGVILFDSLMYSCYLTILIGLLFGIYRWPILIVFATLPLVFKHVKAFNHQQVKSKTFVVSIKNLVLFNSSYALGLLLTILLEYWQG